MSGAKGAEPHRVYVDAPSSIASDVARYGVSVVLVVVFGAGMAYWASQAAPAPETAELDNVVTVDLPPAEASSRPTSDATDGPEQQAAQAAPAEQAPDPVEPPKPVDDPKPEAQEKAPEPPPPEVPDAPAVLRREQDKVAPPPAIVAPPALAQDAHAPVGSEAPTKTDAEDEEEGSPPPSAHAITLWQRSLMRRLEAAKHEMAHEPHGSGTVKVAFEIDGKGALASEHVAQSSGSALLDKAALLLIRRAAPYPAPPSHAASHDTSFVVPVRFR